MQVEPANSMLPAVADPTPCARYHATRSDRKVVLSRRLSAKRRVSMESRYGTSLSSRTVTGAGAKKQVHTGKLPMPVIVATLRLIALLLWCWDSSQLLYIYWADV